MFEARLADGTPIDIDQFRYLEDAERLVLFCTGCSAKVSAIAWRPGIRYKRCSYFRLDRGEEHDADCLAEAYDEFVGSGKKREIRSASDIPGGYPACLVFRRREKHSESTNDPSIAAKDRYVYGNSRPPDGGNFTRWANTTSSFLQVCRFYLNRPEGRDLPFHGDGLEGAKYKEVFKSLHLFTTERVLPKRIYFGSLPFKMKPEISPDSLLLTLMQKVKGENERHYRLEICWNDWSEIRKTNFSKEIEEKRAFLREQWIREKQSSSSQQSCLYVFFIANQSENDLAVFRVSDPRYVCLLPSSYMAM